MFLLQILESSGFGLVGFNLLGTTTVRYCHFYNNPGNASANTLGRNVLMYFERVRQEFNYYYIEVFNSKFTFGSNPQGSWGLEITFRSDANVDIHISCC